VGRLSRSAVRSTMELAMIGKTLAHYEIASLLGRGGMGEVYQAKDQKLGRDVAIKVLPEEFAKDADRVARFQREAKLLASLNHPNIASIYGLEESDGTHFLVLELVEGDTLSDRIKAGPIPVEEALKLALQIAEALEAAHEKGVIHRDLKPSNIKVTPDGKVKVLDFGLAKAFAGDQEEMILSDSPTLSVAATQRGVILGTAAYMSPEQARGKPVDKRVDIWAFGVVLFEMLTGRPVFAGDDVSQTLARVLERQPDFSALPPNLHPKIIGMLERCLEKEAKNRYSGINDARVDIQKVLADPSGVLVQPVTTAEPRKKLRLGIPWVAAAVVLTAIIVGAVVLNLRPTPQSEPRRVIRLDYELPDDQQSNINALRPGHTLAVSLDGSKFIYSISGGLYLRSEDELKARLILGTDKDNPQSPFFSPDGQWVGYWSQADNKLKKIAIGGGAPVALCDVIWVNGAIWNTDNTIVYADVMSGIMRVSANGGTPELLVGGPSSSPQFLPDGKSVIFTNPFGSNMLVQSLESGERKGLAGRLGRYLPTGHLVYLLAGNLYAVPFDLDTLEVTGGPVPFVEGVGQFVISDSGTLVYLPGTSGGAASGRTLVWVDREGQEEPLDAPPNDYLHPKISPDGTQVALTIYTGGNADIYIWDIVRETLTRLTFDESADGDPIWTLDGKRIVFRSQADSVYWKAADGTGEVEQLVSVPGRIITPRSWSSDGNTLVLEELDFTKGGYFDIGILSMEGERVRKPLLQSAGQPKISPDGRWMAHSSLQGLVCVRPFPEIDKGKWQVSTSRGNSALWSPDGRELFYRSGDAVMAVAVDTEPTFKPGKPVLLFRGTYVAGRGEGVPWDISPDGKRFLMIKPGEATENEPVTEAPRKIIVVTNWFEELKERVPVP
jgi:serine/threonine protein kinase